MTPVIIAIDGYASTGKSTVAKRLAKHFGYTYMDTGYMFRVISFFVVENNLIKDGIVDESSLCEALPSLNFSWEKTKSGLHALSVNGRIYGDEIRTARISSVVSVIAKIPTVRTHLLQQQRQLAESISVVVDGRDIGTVVLPHATHKFFLNAKAEIRAQRRYKEMQNKGLNTTFEAVLANVIERDEIDSTRAVAPLKKADDAIEIDTSMLSEDEVFSQLKNCITA
ncbi:MAG: (d)CMP kinase [Flavobacteriaceae bacterium]